MKKTEHVSGPASEDTVVRFTIWEKDENGHWLDIDFGLVRYGEERDLSYDDETQKLEVIETAH